LWLTLATIDGMAGVSFDRAADYYDATRALPSEVARQVADVLSSELVGKELCLEIGVGTGRIALPLAERGIELLGVDLAPSMLARLLANAGGKLSFPLLTADVTSLPLAASSVDAVLGCHVLHLIADWQTALDEAGRVLRPGGLVLLDFGGPTPKPWSDDCGAILKGHGVLRTRPGVSSPDLVAEYLAERAPRRALPPIQFTEEVSLAEDLEEWENQILAWTWAYPPEQLRVACDEIRATALSLGWDIYQKVCIQAFIQWWAFDFGN
jgi:ubiquinone/menaquinone biosynthesis C-methylase UbiE